ncbi:MAG: DUF1232 domain-containing protein [Clostridiaceae bacterium]
MRVTSLTTTLSAEDILHDLQTVVETEVEGLAFKSVKLEDNFIEIIGSFKKLISIPFLARVRIISVFNNIMTLKIERVKVLKIGIPKFVLNIASKTLASKAEEMGLKYENKSLSVNIEEVLQKVPHVHMVVDEFTMADGVLSLKIKGIEADLEAMQAESNKDKEEEERLLAEEEAKKIKEFNEKLKLVQKTEDSYTGFRDKVLDKVPFNRRNIADYAFILPDIYALAFRLLKDKRVSKRDKVLIGVTFGYPLLPFDLLPDKIPVLGKLDDLTLIFFGVNHIMKKIPVPILVKHWQGDLKMLKLVKDNVGTVANFTPAKTLDQVYGVVDNAMEKKKKSYLNDEFYLIPDSEVKALDLDPIFDPIITPKAESVINRNVEEDKKKKPYGE